MNWNRNEAGFQVMVDRLVKSKPMSRKEAEKVLVKHYTEAWGEESK